MGQPRLLVIANPRAGRRAALRVVEAARPILEGAGMALEVRRTTRPGDAATILRTADLQGLHGILAAGGDGTLHEIVNALLARGDGQQTPVGVLPAGTGDALARDLGLERVADAARPVAEGTTRVIDLAQVLVDGTQHHAFSVVGWGAFARINRRAERWRFLRGARYGAAAAFELSLPWLRGAEAARDGRSGDGLLLGVACLTRHTGRGMDMAPGAELDDGWMDLVEIRRAPRKHLARLLQSVYTGDHVRSPLVRTTRVTRFRLELEPGSWLVLDGDALPARAVEARILPGALRVFGGDRPDRIGGAREAAQEP